jgi:hypothetical protein
MMDVVRLEVPAAAVADEVSAEDYSRLLGLPRGRPLGEDFGPRAEAARAWFVAHARPTAASRRLAIEPCADDMVTTETGATFASPTLAAHLEEGGAHALVALAVSAGPEVDAESQRLTAAGRPDEAYFIDRFGAVATQRMVLWAVRHLCREASPRGETLLAHLSPGCGGWAFDDQPALLRLLAPGGEPPVPLRMLESGMLTPKNSLLALAGVTRRTLAPAAKDVCHACDLAPCAFRRRPYVPRSASSSVA